MIEAVTDHNLEKGHTKSPNVPVPTVHVTDVESKPDPIAIDADHESTEAPDNTKPIAEVGPEENVKPATLLQRDQGLSAEILAEVNKNQENFNSENSQFLAIKQAHSQQIVEKVSNMNKEMDEFSHTLDMSHYDNAI